MYKIRTIDVWDTLLRRDCHPECIKLMTAHHLLFGWCDHIKPEFRDGWVLYKVRLEAERMLALQAKAAGKDDEYEITQVLAQWSAEIFADTVPPDLPNRLAEFELSVEVDRSFADSDIVEFLRSQEAEKTLFLSDFYMSGEMLRRLLSAKGLNTLVAEGISSCDVGLNKRSGQIFRHVHFIHAISPQEHVHIGDNGWSDVSSPSALGVHALHYLPESAHAERLAREHLFSSREALFDHILGECSALTQEASGGLSVKQAAAISLGIQAAPLFIGFMLWTAEQAVIRKLERLYFFTREGEFFHKVFRTIFPEGRLFGHDLPPADILEVSRLSTFAPSMKTASIQEMSRIWSLFKVQSVSGLFTTLGLDIGRFSELLDTLNLKETDVITDPESSSKLHRLFESQAFAKAVENSLASQSSMLQSYLKQNCVYHCNRVGIVDIGWRGTIQDNISLLVPAVHFHGMYLGLRRVINVQPGNASKEAYVADENMASVSNSLFTNFAAMELLCNSPHGSVVGYTLGDGHAKAQRHVDKEEDATYDEFVKPFQDGVLLAAKHWQSYLERYVVSSNELHTVALRVWDKLRTTPDQGLVEAYLRTPQQDTFGYGEIFSRNHYPSLSTIFLSPILASRRMELIEFIRRVQWTEAIENAKEIGPIHRTVLRLAFQAAHLIKRAVLKARRAGIRTKKRGQ
jgi:FMN phosphatase YigB (HAD superfamily)